MRDSDAAEVGEEEEEGLASGVFLGASAVGPHSVHDPRVDGRDAGSHGVGGVRMAGKDAERAVLEQVEEPHVDDECGCADQTKLDEFLDPCAQGFREALGGLDALAGAGCSTLAEAVVGVTCSVSCVGTVKILTFISSSVWEGTAQVRSRCRCAPLEYEHD